MQQTFFHNRKNAFFTLFFFVVLALCSLIFFKENDSVKLLAVLISLCLPYIIPFIVFGGLANKQKYFDPLWIKVLIFFLLTIYIALSSSWASSVVNEVFYVPSSNFPITTALVNIAYLPYNFFGSFLAYTLVAVIIFVPFLMAFIFFFKEGKASLKFFVYLIIFAIYMGVSMSSISLFEQNKNVIVKSLALKLDFDAKNSCSGFSSDNYKVAHIGNGKVIVFDTNEPMDAIDQFKIHECKL